MQNININKGFAALFVDLKSLNVSSLRSLPSPCPYHIKLFVGIEHGGDGEGCGAGGGQGKVGVDDGAVLVLAGSCTPVEGWPVDPEEHRAYGEKEGV